MHRFLRLYRSQTVLTGLAILAALVSFLLTAGADENPHQTAEVRSEVLSEAIFAGGCFWCVEADFDKVDGVLETISGYIGGTVDNPTYKQVVRENTGHYEAVKVVYDPDVVSYSELVEYFWRHVDPTDAGGQFCDRGDSYRTAIFTMNDAQFATATASKEALETSDVLAAPVVTPIIEASSFWPAEEYHQNFYKKSRLRYNSYRRGCGRDARVEAVWAGAGDHS